MKVFEQFCQVINHHRWWKFSSLQWRKLIHMQVFVVFLPVFGLNNSTKPLKGITAN